MSPTLPYLPSPGSIRTAFEKIRTAATPSRVTKDFVSTVLLIKGGTGDAIAPFLKRIGMVASDGTPTDIYKRFRNPASAGKAIAEAIFIGYQELSQANEYFYRLSDKDLKALIVQVTGADANGRVAQLTFNTLNILRSYADFDTIEPAEEHAASPERFGFPEVDAAAVANPISRTGFNLAYTINLNLPATSDQAVFNAIFRSLKEHLLSNGD